MSEKKEIFILPQELQVQILLSLPVKSLLRFKSISKNWHSLIGSSVFSKRYLQISNAGDNNKILCFRKDPIAKTHVISILDDQITDKIVDLEWPPFLDEGIENKERFDRRISVLGPVNGVYCIINSLVERGVGTLVLWNPATREYKHILPPIALPMAPQLVGGKWKKVDDYFYYWRSPIGISIGFGIDDNTNDYKVVVISHWSLCDGPDDDRWHVRVYNLSTNSWRTVYYLTLYSDVLSPFDGLYPPFPRIHTYPDHPHCLLNGVFHWMAWEGIVAFDVVNESFHLIEEPNPPDKYYNCSSVWVLKQTLAVFLCSVDVNNSPSNMVELWMMMKYGMADTWTMLHSFNGLYPIGIPNDHHIFLCNDKEQLISFRLDDHQIKEYDIYGAPVLYENLPSIHKNLGVAKYVENIESLKGKHQ